MHHRLFHLPYSKIFQLLKEVLIPKHFLCLKDRPHPCASCMFGAQHWKNWRTKTSKHGKKSELEKEDFDKARTMCFISAQTGSIPQEKGNLTRARIWACTVFVDYYTGYVFVALMRDLTAKSMLATKKEFENQGAV